MAKQSMLTTIDNPYNPFTDWSEWFAFDQEKKHYTPALLARVTRTSDELSEADQDLALDQAIDEIIRENVDGIYKKVFSEN